MLIFTDAAPRGHGYFELDQRNVEAALPPGVARYFEAETYTCSHCHAVVVLETKRTRERYKCSGCNHHVCDGCAADRVAGGACRPLNQVIEEARERAARQPGSIILP